MYSRYSDVSLKNVIWRKIWIRDIEGILMMLIKNPENEANITPRNQQINKPKKSWIKQDLPLSLPLLPWESGL
jgi:hypothetical protein